MIKTIYLLEDDEELGKVIKVVLANHGYHAKIFNQVITFRLALQDELPDLAIMDVMLPDGNGIDICKEFKLNKVTQHIPLIVISGLSINNYNSFAEGYLSKPFEIKDIILQVENLI
jgi:DNA-binding response OmpR family regulator